MIIDVSFDSSVNNCPQEAAFKACAEAVADFYESEFNNPITITWDLGWGEVQGSSIPDGSGAESDSNYTATEYTYAQVRAAFIKDADSAADKSADASLTTTDPTKGGAFQATTAEAKALGLSYSGTTNDNSIDGYSGLDKTTSWVFNTTNTNGASTLAVNGTDAFSFLAHELSEVMGRQMNFAPTDPYNYGGTYYPEDLFDYTAAGVRSFSSAAAHRYFSDNGGVTNTGQHWFNDNSNNGDPFDNIPNGQPGSYLPNGVPDSYDYEGTVGAVSSEDITLMNVLGYDITKPVTWASQVSGTFSTAADWEGEAAPTAADIAHLTATGATPYTVTAAVSTTVSSVETGSTATLAVTGGTFTATQGTGASENAGAISVAAGATLAVGGIVDNAGKVTVAAGGTLLVAGSGLITTGSGNLSLAGAIKGASASATLTNGSLISGAGQLGDGVMTLVNLSGARIESVGPAMLTIDTGTAAVTNLGLIESDGGGLVITGAVANGDTPKNGTTVATTYGQLEALSGALTVDGAVSGVGIGEVGAGTLDFASTFNENVTFLSGSTGTLELAHSQTYTTGKITGLSTSGKNALDLVDIDYVAGTTKATYSGTTTSGVLTVTDGTHTAKIHMVGDYVGARWTLSADGGGTKVVDPSASATASAPAAANPQAFVGAMASLGASVGGHLHGSEHALLDRNALSIAAPRSANLA
jgi:hypothetical protein